MHSDDVPDQLVQLAVLNAEFEAIHPFIDGNGRIGRMIIPLLLWRWKIIFQPRFYISSFLEAHREDYYEGSLSVSRDGDWMQWITFFLNAVANQTEANFKQAESILELYDTLKQRLPELTRSSCGMRALGWIFEYPIFLRSDFLNGLEVSSATSRRLIGVFREQQIIKQLRSGSGRRPEVFVFPALLDIVDV